MGYFFAIFATICALMLWVKWCNVSAQRRPLQPVHWRYHLVDRWWLTFDLMIWSYLLVVDLVCWAVWWWLS